MEIFPKFQEPKLPEGTYCFSSRTELGGLEIESDNNSAFVASLLPLFTQIQEVKKVSIDNPNGGTQEVLDISLTGVSEKETVGVSITLRFNLKTLNQLISLAKKE